MSEQDNGWLGDERCELLEDIKQDIENFDSISDEQRSILSSAIEMLLTLYGCNFED